MTEAHALDTDGVVQLAVLERSGFIESRHSGAAVVTDASGAVARTLGDATALVYPRSSLKPLQALAALRAGAPLHDERLVLATASHSGLREHKRIVLSILDDALVTTHDLQCPKDWPSDQGARDDMVRIGESADRISMNCSGKHAAFLAACVAQGWDTASYLDPSHPLQQLILEVVEEYTGEAVTVTGIDGCGAPVHAVTLAGMARATSLIARGLDGAGNSDANAIDLVAAVLSNSWAIDGPGRPNTVVIDELGLFAKGGAEGYLVIAALTGEAVAVKILDGGHRAATLVALRLLADAGVIDAAAADRVAGLATPAVTGGEQVVGSLRPAFG